METITKIIKELNALGEKLAKGKISEKEYYTLLMVYSRDLSQISNKLRKLS